MNTPSAAKTIERLIDLFPPGDQPQVRMTLAGGLRLDRRPASGPNADRRELVAAAELLPGIVALWNLIRDKKTFQIPSLQQRGKSLGHHAARRLAGRPRAQRGSRSSALEIAEECADGPGRSLRRPAPHSADRPPVRRRPFAGEHHAR